MSHEPGLDEHDWQSEYASIQEGLEDDPSAALPQLADLAERILSEQGFDVSEPVELSGDERSIVASYLAARETSDRVERDEDVDPGDVGAAIANLRELLKALGAESPAG
jgi:hypothetical protein